MSVDTTGLVKVVFKLDPDDWHAMHIESMWAEPVKGTDARDLYRLQNSPFYTYDVSYLDIVRAALGEFRDVRFINPGVGEGLDFIELVDPSGHSTYRFFVQDKDDPVFQSYWKCPACNRH
jgi:hypothetical protein